MEERTNFIFENAPMAICFGEVILNDSGRIIDYKYDRINAQYALITGLNPADIKGKRMSKLFRPADYARTFKNIQSFIDTGENTFELYLSTFKKHLKIQYTRLDEGHICTWVSDMTPDKLLIQNLDEIIQETPVSYPELTQRALAISGAAYGALNIYEEHTDFFRTVALAGINENIMKAAKLLGFSPENKRWQKDPVLEEKTDRQTLTRFASFFDLSGKILPKPVVQKMAAVFKLNAVYVCKIQKDRQTVGNFTLFFGKGQELKNKNDLITYAQQVALRILKNRMEEKYKSIINHSNDAIYIHGFDEDGTPGFFSEVNQKGCEELGYTYEEFLRLKIEDIDPGVSTKKKKEIVSKLFDQQFVQFETQHYRKDGIPVHVEVNTGLMNDNGRVLAISIARNIDERKRYEEKLGVYKKIISTITDSMAFIDRDMRFVMVNDAVAGFYKTTPSAIEGRAVEEVVGRDYFESTLKPNIHKTLKGENTQYETWFEGSDQKKRYMNVRCYPYYDKTGTIIGCMTHGRDMTLEKQMKDEIIRNHEVLNRMIELLPGTLTLINRDYEILLTNQKSEKLSITPFDSTDNFIGKRCYDIFHHRETPCPWCASGQVFETGKSVFEETTPDDPREQLTGQAYQLYYAPVRDETGAIIGCIEYMTTVTKYREAYRKVEEALKNKTEALSTISHEIRNQMNGMLNLSELIQNTGYDEDSGLLLERLIYSGRQLIKVLENTLMMSKFESGNIRLDLAETNLSKLIEKNAEDIRIPASEKQNSIHVDIPNHLPSVYADETRLNQVLINLLSNANKFTNQGDIYLSLKKLRENEQTVTVELAVSDTGIGIPEKLKQNILKAYDQGMIRIDSKYGGTGIGLTISNKLLALMDTTLSIQSVEGEASTFSFTLTLNKVHQEAKPEKVSSGSPLKVLIADDHDISRVIAETMIRMYNPDVQIQMAENGEEALSFYKRYKPDCILLDIQMPKMDGFQVVEKIRETEKADQTEKPTVIIGYSAILDKQKIQKALENGINDFIQKPVLQHILNGCLKKHGF